MADNSLLTLFSQVLGYAVIAGSALFQFPQIYTILTKRTAEGISLTAYLVEMLMFCASSAWGIAHDLPIATYGENILVVVQVGVVLLLIGWYQKRMTAAGGGTAVLVVLMLLMSARVTPDWVLTFFYGSQVVNTILAKAPQVALNHRRRGTGALNLLTVSLMFIGATTRVFTTGVEVPWEKGKAIMLAGFSCGMVLNGIMLSQFFIYKKSYEDKEKGAMGEVVDEGNAKNNDDDGHEEVKERGTSVSAANPSAECRVVVVENHTVKPDILFSILEETAIGSVAEGSGNSKSSLVHGRPMYPQQGVLIRLSSSSPSPRSGSLKTECSRHSDAAAERTLPISSSSSPSPLPRDGEDT